MKKMIVNDHFIDYITNWDSRFKLAVGSYGSSKSYATAQSIIVKAIQEKRKILVVRAVHNTLRDSCFSLIKDVVYTMGLESYFKFTTSPLGIKCVNGSEFIFRGTDDPQKLKSIHNVSLVWIEEASEVSYDSFKELNGRLRGGNVKLHMVLSTNPVSKNNWIFTHFFENAKVDEEELYKKRLFTKDDVYYHHSIVTDNKFVDDEYIKQLDDYLKYDEYMYQVARLGRFGVLGERVLKSVYQMDHDEVMRKIINLNGFHAHGMDFGFASSYNSVTSCFVDTDNKDLYVYKEIYVNKITDNVMAELEEFQWYRDNEILIVADSAEPKTIKYYKDCGYRMTGAVKGQGSRIANTKKMRRFRNIYISTDCFHTYAELKDLTFKKDKNGAYVMGEFNTDPHTFSSIWYSLHKYEVTEPLKKLII